MNTNNLKWLFLVILSVVWGSSFILIKKGLLGLTAYQLGSIRIIFTSVFLFIIGFSSLKKIRKQDYKWIVITSLLGTFFPVYAFALAETQIDSSIASVLNSLTPLNTLILGYFFFNFVFLKKQLIGIVIGFFGTILLIISGAHLNPDQNYWFSAFVVFASICYAFNVNIIKNHLQDLSAMSITVGNFSVISIPAFIILCFTNFFDSEVISNSKIHESLGYILLLAIFGTGIAKIVYNRLVQISTPIFASSVTYTIPIVALAWGVLDGEQLNFMQIIAALIILLGVYLANKKA